MSLPVEIWMMVLEHITFDESVLARCRMIQSFAEAMEDGASEADALEDLPYFEKRAWFAATTYYYIDRNSHAAAGRLGLTLKLLRQCASPCTAAPGDLYERSDGRLMTCKKGHEPDSDSILLPPVSDYSLASIAIDLFHPEAFSEELCRYSASSTPKLFRDALGRMKDTHQADFAEWDILGQVDRVDLLFAAPQDALDTLAHLYADDLKETIVNTWAEIGVEGEVRLLV